MVKFVIVSNKFPSNSYIGTLILGFLYLSINGFTACICHTFASLCIRIIIRKKLAPASKPRIGVPSPYGPEKLPFLKEITLISFQNQSCSSYFSAPVFYILRYSYLIKLYCDNSIVILKICFFLLFLFYLLYSSMLNQLKRYFRR